MAKQLLNGDVSKALDKARSDAMALPQRPTMPMALPDMTGIGACHGSWGDIWPVLTGFLCDALYPDGKPIGLVRVSFSREESRIRIKLQLGSGELCIQAHGGSPDEAMTSLEGLLRVPAGPWEKDRYPIGKKPGKKK